MDEKDKVDAYLKLATFRQTRRDSRLQTLLRISIGLWAVLAAGAISIKNRPPEYLFVTLLVVISVGHAIAAQQTLLRSRQDASAAFYYSEHAEMILLGHPAPRSRPKGVHEMTFSERWLQVEHDLSAIFWFAPTALLAFGAYFFIGR